MDIKAKLRPFYVAKMLYEQTDEDHYLTIAQIMEQLKEEYGITTSRGTVSDDIKALQEFGVEIAVEPSTQNRYFLICRRFDLPELKTLIDAVESARFIPKEKSAALVEKLGSLTSCHNTSKLVRNVNNLAVHVLNVLNTVDKRKTLAVNHIAVVSAGLNFKVVIERGDLQNRLIALTCGYRTVKLARLARTADYQSLAVLHQLAFGNYRSSVKIFNI